MNSFTKLFTIEKINARRATRGFFHALWHLRSLIGMLLIVFFVLSVLMFYFGAPVDSSTHVPSSFGETLYFCGVTALTIGYGDVVATTGIGRILSVMLGLHGVLVTGLTTAAAVFAVQRTVGDAH
ncbi:potassium channel family protein [Caballeronia glebae]|uniref:potassium channel family protein n=1 Tax=Caballeronia glebae TaxID=1777143 RepID=UPI0038BC7DBE